MAGSSNPVQQAIEALAKERGIEPQMVIAAMEDALLTSARRVFKAGENLKARFNPETGHVKMGFEMLPAAFSLVGMEGRLAHTHWNSQPLGNYDQDLNVGVVSPEQAEALLYTLKMYGYQGYFGLDINPERMPVDVAVKICIDAVRAANDRVDELAGRAMEDFVRAFDAHRTPRGGFHWMLMASNVQNISAGREVGATPDGRRSGQPTSDACSPTFGRDQGGPTATVRSISKLPYHLAPGGNVVNMKLHPDSLAGPGGLEALATLIRTCFALGGSELQFNTTDSAVLRAAMENPEPYASLVVRVSGFSAAYVRLGRAVQEDILARTEHSLPQPR